MFTSKWSKEAKEEVLQMSQKEKERLHAIIAMNTLVISMHDEADLRWICIVPDCADEYDFIDFAVNDDETEENHLFDEAVELFKELWAKYAAEDKGLYIGGKCY